jgi:uncharacterized protein YjiS (DUF1127 family)
MERNRHEPAFYGTTGSEGAPSTALRTFMRSSGEAIGTLTLWPGRRRSRQQLANLSDQILQDIGITRDQVEREYGKPFWRA